MDIKNSSCEYTELNAQKKENETLPIKLGFQLKLRSVFLGMFFGIFMQLSTIGADSLVTTVTKQGNANQMPYSPLISYGILSIPGIIAVCMMGFIQLIFNILVHSTFMSMSQRKVLEASLSVIKINFAVGIYLGTELIWSGRSLLVNASVSLELIVFTMMGCLLSLLVIPVDWTGASMMRERKLLEAAAWVITFNVAFNRLVGILPLAAYFVLQLLLIFSYAYFSWAPKNEELGINIEDIDLTGKATTPKSPHTLPLHCGSLIL